MTDYSSIKIGPHRLHRLEYNQIEPGDLVCTYEALTTRSDLQAIECLQNWANLSYRPELNKMFHAEIVVDVFPRSGVCQIAHADGSSQKVLTQTDHFKDHHPGQALIIFRAKNPRLRKEIISIAKKTAESNNGHRCKTLKSGSLFQNIIRMASLLWYENTKNNASDSILKNIAHMTINYEKNGRFYDQNGTGSQEMRCIEYIANVVNVAATRILCRDILDDPHIPNKVTAIFNRIKTLNKDHSYPFKFSHSNATPASLANFFLTHPENFQTTGYLGAISEHIESPALNLQGEPIQISHQWISKMLKGQVDPTHAAQIMKVLGMINDSWQIYPKTFKDVSKIKTFLTYTRTTLNENDVFLSIDNLSKETREIHDQPSSKIESLSYKDTQLILSLEQQLIKSSSLERTEKTLKLSMNVLEQQKNKNDHLKSVLEKIFWINKKIQNSTFLYPLHLGLSSVKRWLYKSISLQEAKIQKMKYEILAMHEKIRKNGFIQLITHNVNDHRPWIQYSINEGKTWNLEPFKKIDINLWQASLQISEDKNVSYHLFIGPEDIKDPDPIGKSIAWTNWDKETIVSPQSMIKTSEDACSYLNLPICYDPFFNDQANIPFNRTKLLTYHNHCNSIAPNETWPQSVHQYEENFAILENQVESIAHDESQDDHEELINHLRSFLEKELLITVPTSQIQHIKGGLGKGLSGDQIYKVVNEKQQPILIIKVFMKSRGKFSREFFSLMNHEKLQLKSLNIPKVTGIGSTQIQKKRVVFLAMNYIPGISLHQMFEELFMYKPKSLERQKSFTKLLHVYSKLGQGIAEFHQSSKGTQQFLHPILIDLLKNFSKNALKQIQSHCDLVFFKKLEAFLTEGIDYISQQPFSRGYIHGDINTGNIIYNPATNRLSIIDWPDGSFSIGKDGRPLGVSFYDLIQIKNELMTKKAQGLEEEEFDQLYSIFIEKYKSNEGTVPSDKALHFFTCIDILGSLKWFLDKGAMFDSEQFKIAQKIYQSKQQQLTNLVIPRVNQKSEMEDEALLRL